MIKASENSSLQQFQSNKYYYEEFIAKHQRLPGIIKQKQNIVKSLILQNHKLDQNIDLRRQQIAQLQRRLEEFERMEYQISKSQEKQRKMESQFEDYQQLNSRLQKQLKLLNEQSQILKGKAIIEFNKIAQIRQQSAVQGRQAQILEKHHQEMKKSGETLKKKVKPLRQQLKKRSGNKRKIEQSDLQMQITSLKGQLRQNREELEEQIKNRNLCMSQSQFKERMQEIERLRESNGELDRCEKQSARLQEEKSALEQRILFLESVDIQFINQKKMLLVELNKKYNIFLTQKSAQLSNLALKQQRLAELQAKYPDGVNSYRKVGRRRKQPKLRHCQKVEKEEEDERSSEPVAEERSYRFRGQKLKKRLFTMLNGLLIFGLILSQLMEII